MLHVVSSTSRRADRPAAAGSDVEPRIRRSRPPSSLRRRLASATALVLVALGAMPALVAAQENVVAGTVVAERSDRPIAGAQVSVQGEVGRGSVADASGRVRITGITGSTVTLNARMNGQHALA